MEFLGIIEINMEWNRENTAYELDLCFAGAFQWITEISEHRAQTITPIIGLTVKLIVAVMSDESLSDLFSIDNVLFVLATILDVWRVCQDKDGQSWATDRGPSERQRSIVALGLWIIGNGLLLARSSWQGVDGIALLLFVLVRMEYYFRIFIILSLTLLFMGVAVVEKICTGFKDWQLNHCCYKRFQHPDATCAICLSDSTDTKLKCGHHYHRECICTWNKYSFRCPLCKKHIL